MHFMLSELWWLVEVFLGGIGSSHLNFQIYVFVELLVVIPIILLMSARVCSDISYFILDIGNLCLLSLYFFFWSVLLEVCQFYIAFQRTSPLFY